MSRSLDSMSLTTRPSIAIVPPVTSSSPASMRSKVDLPQPDGPTSTMNSPSWMSNSTPWITAVAPKDLRTSRNDTVAMRWGLGISALDGAGREPRHHVALERVVDRRRRQRVDEAGGHQQLPRRVVGREKVAERDRQR